MPNPSNKISVATVGKAILAGEHAVLYGASALAIPLPLLKLNLEIQTCEIGEARFLFDNQAVNGTVKEVILSACKKFNINPETIQVCATSDIPIGAGLGSSAALCVGLVQAFAKIQDLALDHRKVYELATELENRFHGQSSGLDCAVVTYQKPLLFKRHHQPEFVDFELPKGFFLIDSLKRTATQIMVDRTARHFQNDSTLAGQFDDCCNLTITALHQKSPDLLAQSIRQLHHLHNKIEIVGELNEIIDVSLECGALAAKITGAGGGGCILCYAPDKTEQVYENMRQKLPNTKVFRIS